MRLVGWIVNPVSSFDSRHQPVGWEDGKFVIGPHIMDPYDLPQSLAHSNDWIIWTTLDCTVKPDPTYYDSLMVNILTETSNQQSLNDKWMAYCEDSEGKEPPGSNDPTDLQQMPGSDPNIL